MLVSKDNSGNVIGWMETYFGDNRTVTVNVHRNFTTILTQDRTTGQVKSETFVGKPPLPSDFKSGNK